MTIKENAREFLGQTMLAVNPTVNRAVNIIDELLAENERLESDLATVRGDCNVFSREQLMAHFDDTDCDCTLCTIARKYQKGK